MNANQFLSEVGRNSGLGALAFDDQGVCRLVFDDVTAVDVELSADGDWLYLHSALGAVPADADHRFYAMLLTANFYGRGAGGNVLSIVPVEQSAYLCRTLPLEGLDPAGFVDLLAEFVRQARRWSARIAAGPDPPSSGGGTAPDALGGMVRV